jgi:hypothetical protein
MCLIGEIFKTFGEEGNGANVTTPLSMTIEVSGEVSGL